MLETWLLGGFVAYNAIETIVERRIPVLRDFGAAILPVIYIYFISLVKYKNKEIRILPFVNLVFFALQLAYPDYFRPSGNAERYRRCDWRFSALFVVVVHSTTHNKRTPRISCMKPEGVSIFVDILLTMATRLRRGDERGDAVTICLAFQRKNDVTACCVGEYPAYFAPKLPDPESVVTTAHNIYRQYAGPRFIHESGKFAVLSLSKRWLQKRFGAKFEVATSRSQSGSQHT